MARQEARAGAARFGHGLARGADLRAAATSAAGAATDGLPGDPGLVLAFVAGGTPEQVEAALDQVRVVSAGRCVLGAGVHGVLAGERGVQAGPAVSVLAAELPGVRVRSFHLESLPAESGTAVVGLPERDAEDIAVLLADPYSFPAAGFAARSAAALPGLALVGGLVGTGQGPGRARLHVDGRTVERGAVGLLLGGSGAIPVVSQGCRAVGPPMTVTAAAGNVVHGLAGEPALSRISALLQQLPPQDQALASAGLHLGIAVDEYADDHDFLVRPVLGAERAGGGLVVGDLVEVGMTVRLQVRDADAADAELARCLSRLTATGTAVAGALLFSCVGRGSSLFGASHGGADHDPSQVSAALRPQGLAGMFAAGELGPVAGRNALHGQTACLLAFPEH